MTAPVDIFTIILAFEKRTSQPICLAPQELHSLATKIQLDGFTIFS